jgi:hypothetical protein
MKKAEPALQEANNLCSPSRTYDQSAPEEAKVFWFFFSKKNILSVPAQDAHFTGGISEFELIYLTVM